MPSSRDPDYYRCFCGVHVHTFVFIVSIILVTINAIAAIGFIVGGKSNEQAPGIVGFVIGFASNICLLVGNRQKIHMLYWPFLIGQIIYVICAAVLLVFCILILAGSMVGGPVATSAAAILILPLLILIFFVFYFFSIVHRDYKYVRDELI